MVALTIIVPTLNRGPLLASALESIGRVVGQSPSDEVIVVDNGSTDRTRDVCRDVAERFPDVSWKYVYDDMPGLLTGRHRGAAAARGEILSFLDDDVILEPTWLASVKEAFADARVALVGGPSRPRYEADPPPWLEAFWTEAGAEHGRRCGALSLIDAGPDIKDVDPRYVWGLNFSIRRSVFEECGGFHPDCIPKALQRYQGDGETGLALKLKERGYLARHHPGAALWHVIPPSRMTPQAMEQRGFYQGVCDSFAHIRKTGVVLPAPPPSWRDALGPAKRRLHRAWLMRRSDGASVMRLMARAQTEGFWFHQREVARDPALLEWVLRADFLDYELPQGWKERLAPAR